MRWLHSGCRGPSVLAPGVSDCIWGNDLSKTITQCLRKQLEQLQDLREALGRLTLSSSPGGSGESSARSTSPVRCVCYGLGNFASSVTARSQLAFMLLFLEKCQVSAVFIIVVSSCTWHGGSVPRTEAAPLPIQIPRSHCQVYDPLFSQAEVSVLTSLGVTVLCENEVGDVISSKTPTSASEQTFCDLSRHLAPACWPS